MRTWLLTQAANLPVQVPGGVLTPLGPRYGQMSGLGVFGTIFNTCQLPGLRRGFPAQRPAQVRSGRGERRGMRAQNEAASRCRTCAGCALMQPDGGIEYPRPAAVRMYAYHQEPVSCTSQA